MGFPARLNLTPRLGKLSEISLTKVHLHGFKGQIYGLKCPNTYAIESTASSVESTALAMYPKLTIAA